MRCFAAFLAVAGTGFFIIGAPSAQPAPVQRLTLLTHPRIPPPPAAVGCYRFRAEGWRTIRCATQPYIQKHFPQPEVRFGPETLSGIGNTGRAVVKNDVTEAAAPFTVSEVSARPVDQQGGSESDSNAGPGAYSVQDNSWFSGTNGKRDAVQFVDQVSPWVSPSLSLNGVCVWQIVSLAHSFTPTCATALLPVGAPVVSVEGNVQGGLLTVAAEAAGGSAIAVTTPDLYGLGAGDDFNNSSGSILGYGNNSEAVFTNTEEEISIQVSSCVNDAGFIGNSVFCTGDKLKPQTFVGYSPGAISNDSSTTETNNLIPVIGSPPVTLPKLAYSHGGQTASIAYTATTSGHCFTGSLPFCF